MTHESPTTKYFSAAVSQILEHEGHGAQANLARRARVSASYLNDLLSGRKAYWPDPVKERVAQVCGFSVGELLDIGEHYVNEGVFWPHMTKVLDTAAGGIERMARVMQLAAKDAGLKMETVLFTPKTVEAMWPQVSRGYTSNALSDAKLYSQSLSFCKSICGK